jgi:hypothetical protein
MCKSIEDSIFSGSLSYLTGAVLLATGKPKYIWLASFVLVVGSMQWVDAAIWYQKSRGQSSKALTQFAVPTVLSLEIIVGYLGYVYYYGKRMPLYELILLGTVIFLMWSYFHCDESTVDSLGYLIWCGKDKLEPNKLKRNFYRTVLMIFIFFPFLFFPDFLLQLSVIGAGFVLWLLTVNTDSFGSRWCYSFFVLDILILGRVLLMA